MLATDGIGKAGGQCIQRNGSLRVLRNITIPTQRNASRQNPQRFVNSRFFTSWAFLSATVRSEWDIIGSNIVTKNSWGDDRFLSGREAFTRLNSIVFPYVGDTVVPEVVDYFTPLATFGTFVLDADASTLELPIIETDSAYFYQMKAMKLRSSAINPNISKLKTFGREQDITATTDIFDLLESAFGTVQPGMIFSIAIRAVSQSGFTSLWTQQTVIAI